MLERTRPQIETTVVTDRLGRTLHDLRISVIDRCNFRCPYCMPEEDYPEHHQFFRPDERLSFEEIIRLTHLFAGLGVKKVRITGGEPLLRKNLPALIGELAAIDALEDIALTTNGILLAAQAEALRAAGLERVTVSLDSLDDEVFSNMSGGRGDKARVLEGIAAASAAGLTPVKLNVVVQKGQNDHSVLDLLDHFRGSGVIVRLIEYMDVGNRNHWRAEQVVPSRDLLTAINQRWPLRAVDGNYPGEVANRYLYDDGQGEIGFISSVTEPFCRDCTRARLSTNGELYTCLFASRGTDLRGPMRAGASDEELMSLIGDVWTGRIDRYSEERDPGASETHILHKVEMYQVGG
ncbi:MAG: GTP 3',8-cyclase MoaA [Gammaproteobacteria bacterium]|jgi:cyclic pyranopterin phosphate synthase